MNQTEKDFFNVFNHNARKRARELELVLKHPGMSATNKESIRGTQ